MIRRRRALGWLGPAIVLVGAAVAVAGAWYVVRVRPSAGPVIDTIPIDEHRALVVRGEAGGERAFVELRDGDEVKWQALVPRYGGRPGAPGIAWSPTAVSVRVIRDGYAELFALAMHDASKLGGMRLAPRHGRVLTDPSGPITLTDHVRSYEIVSGPDWHQLVAIDLTSGKALWARELGPAAVRSGGIERGVLWIDQGPGQGPGQGGDQRVGQGVGQGPDQGAGPQRIDPLTGADDRPPDPKTSPVLSIH